MACIHICIYFLSADTMWIEGGSVILFLFFCTVHVMFLEISHFINLLNLLVFPTRNLSIATLSTP